MNPNKLVTFELTFPCEGKAQVRLQEKNASLVTKMSSHWGPYPWPTCVWGEHNLTPMKDGHKTDCFNCPLKKGRTVQSGIPMKKSIYCNHVGYRRIQEPPKISREKFFAEQKSQLRKLTEELTTL